MTPALPAEPKLRSNHLYGKTTLPEESPSGNPAVGTSTDSPVRPDLILPQLADDWLRLIVRALSSSGEPVRAPFQIDAAGVTRRFETIISELDQDRRIPRHPDAANASSSPTTPSAESPSHDPDSLQASSQLLDRLNVALQKLSCSTSRHSQSLIVALREITEAATESVNVDRASIWIPVEQDTRLRCLDLFVRSASEHTSGMELPSQSYPSYLAALDTHRVIDAHIAQKDPRTYEFAAEYYAPNGITSALDAPIRRDGRLVGIVSLKHVGPARRWTSEEIAFAGSLADLISLIVESHERRRAEAGVKHSHSLLNAALNATADGILIIDCNSNITGYNKRFLEMWRIPPDVIAKRRTESLIEFILPQVVQPDDFKSRTSAMFSQPDSEVCDLIEFTDGRIFERTSKPQKLDGIIVGRVCCYRDVTASRKAEQTRIAMEGKMVQGQKLEALGTLAGGIAHDFNNILTAVSGHAELALQRTTEPAVQQALAEIFKASERATDLVRQILTFSRQQPAQRKVQRIRPLLEEVIKLMSASLPASIEIKQEFDRGQGSACIDSAQLHQVLMNLCTNAAHAMREHGGVLRLGEGVIEISETAVSNYPGLKPGQHVHLWVSDTGCGMDKATLERIFEPFFTTKPAGEGTGLGLAVVHGILRAHEGIINVESQPGRGTTFHIYLPAVDPSEERARQLTPLNSPRGKGERILYVDDEVSVCQFVRQALELLGYEVHAHSHPVEALEKFRHNSYDYDLVVTDLNMPKVNGIDLSRRIQEIAPGMPVILMSGYDNGVDFPTLAKAGIRRVVTKPVSCRDLAVVVREVLDMDRKGFDDDDD